MLGKIFSRFTRQPPEPSTTRVIILHGHIFKNAGSSFDWSLQRNFGEGFCDHRDDLGMRKGGADYLEEYLNSNNNLSALSSHHLCVPLPEVADIKLVPAYFFRHPIARVRSVYDFERKQPEETPGSIHAKKYNFKDYVSWRMQPDINPTIRNYQVRYCLPKNYMLKDLALEDYNLALSTLNNGALTGVVDRYDETMVVFEEALSEEFPNIDLSYILQNASAKLRSEMNTATKAAKVLDELGSVADELIKQNQFDMKIYEHSNLALDRCAKNVSRFDQKIEEFLKRCALLA